MPSLTTGAARSTAGSAAKAAMASSRLLAGTSTTCVWIWLRLRPALPPCLAIAASFAALVAFALNFTRMGTVGPSCAGVEAAAVEGVVVAASLVASGEGVAVAATGVASLEGALVGDAGGVLDAPGA